MGRVIVSAGAEELTAGLLAVLLLVASSVSAQVQDIVRVGTYNVGTYNIKFFSTRVVDQGDRLQKLQAVIEAVDADVLGLQEIEDRAALHLLFPPSQHDILIDDGSGDRQARRSGSNRLRAESVRP